MSGLIHQLQMIGLAAASVVLVDRAAAASFIDDTALQDKIRQHLEQLNDSTNKVALSELRSQLDRTGAVIRLARPLTRERSWDEIYERTRDSVLIVGSLYKCGKCSRWHSNCASGAIISEDGVLLTNYHVVNNDKGAVLGGMTLGGRFYPASAILAASKREDIALVQLKGEDFKPLPILADKPVGSPVCVLSHPDTAFYSLTTGIISRYSEQPVAPRSKARRHNIVITADYAKGSSGAPIMDDCGNIVGIAASTESVYYNDDHGKQENLQQVVKYGVPAQMILGLIQPAGK